MSGTDQSQGDGWIHKPGSQALLLSNLCHWRVCTLEGTFVATQLSYYRNADQEERKAPEVEQLLIHPETAVALAEALLRAAQGALSGPPNGTMGS